MFLLKLLGWLTLIIPIYRLLKLVVKGAVSIILYPFKKISNKVFKKGDPYLKAIKLISKGDHFALDIWKGNVKVDLIDNGNRAPPYVSDVLHELNSLYGTPVLEYIEEFERIVDFRLQGLRTSCQEKGYI